MNLDHITSAIEELDARIFDSEKTMREMKTAVNVLCDVTGTPVRFSRIDFSRMPVPTAEEPMAATEPPRPGVEKKTQRALKSLRTRGREKSTETKAILAAAEKLGEFRLDDLMAKCPNVAREKNRKFFASALANAIKHKTVSSVSHGRYRWGNAASTPKVSRGTRETAGETPAPPSLQSGRLARIENENVIDAIRRALPLLPKTFTRPDIVARLPLHMTSGTLEKLIGTNIADLRGTGELVFDEQLRADGLQGYQRGPKAKGAA